MGQVQTEEPVPPESPVERAPGVTERPVRDEPGLAPVSSAPRPDDEVATWQNVLSEAHWSAAAASDGERVLEVWSEPASGHSRQLDLFYRVRDAAGEVIGDRRPLVQGPRDDFNPTVTWSPSAGSFLVAYTVGRGHEQQDIWAVSVDASQPGFPARAPFPVDATEEDHDSPRAIWIDSRQKSFIVYRSRTAVFGAYVEEGAGGHAVLVQRLKLIDDRPGWVSYPTVAYSPRTDRILVAWGVQRSQENVEMATMAPGDLRLGIPSRAGWGHRLADCDDQMAPACLEGGDRPAATYHAGLRRFGLAVADDLHGGSRVEGFLIDESCSPAACPVTKAGRPGDDGLPASLREPFLVGLPRVATVSVAPVDGGFIVGYAHGEGGPSAPTQIGVVTFDDVGVARSPFEALMHKQAGDASVAMGSAAAASLGGGGVVLFRYRCGNGDRRVCGQSVLLDLEGHAGWRQEL